MERHFRDKGWTRTRFEVFFNHKKRYMGFRGMETKCGSPPIIAIS
jgi:hypothetical protein